MISRRVAIVVLTASAAILADRAVARSQGQATAGKSQELYQNVYNGWKTWHVYCYRCHGTNAVGTTLAPNLTDPNEKMPLKEFRTIVKTGSADGQMQACGQTARRQTDRAGLRLRQSESRQSAAAGTAGRGRTEGRSLDSASRLVSAALARRQQR